MYADLHLHTRFSDGTFTPEELARRAHRENLAAIALTDHDTVDGCARMATACAGHDVEFIPGAELTAEVGTHEVHILGYFLDTSSTELCETLRRFQQVRQDRIEQMVDRLNSQGVPLRSEAVFSLANCGSPGRPHLARALVQEGFCANYDQAFELYLKKGRPAWVPKEKLNAVAAVELIHGAGGVAVLAHPGLYRADELVPKLVAAGIDGIECWHTKHTAAASDRYVRLATEWQLVTTGGSDCHGDAKGQPLIGTLRIPYQHVTELKHRRDKRHTPPS